MNFRKINTQSFSLDINPSTLTTAQEKGVRIIWAKNGKAIPTFFKKKASILNERMIEIELKSHPPEIKVENDGDTAIFLNITYFFPHPSGTPKWKRCLTSFMTKRPDADNLSKALVDCMTKMGYWPDDSMVNFKFVKFRSPDPHISISIETWRQERP